MTYSSNPIATKPARIGATSGAGNGAEIGAQRGEMRSVAPAASAAPYPSAEPRGYGEQPPRRRAGAAPPIGARIGAGIDAGARRAASYDAPRRAMGRTEMDAWAADRRAAAATPDGAAFDAELVIYRLEEAGTTLLSIPDRGYTTKLRSSSLDIVRSALEAYGWAEKAIRPPVPSAAKIDRMDEALSWIPLIPADKYVLRRIVGARCLISPLTERNLYPWRRLAAALGADHKAIQRWHAQGIDLIVAALNRGQRA
jgi:hypothetical protein